MSNETKKKVKPYGFRIDVASLRRSFSGGKQKMPKDLTFGPAIVNVPCWPKGGGAVANSLNIVIKPTQRSKTMPRIGHPVNMSRKSSVHRIFVICDCGREIPAGRVNQHTH